jgi:predicted P-loop ATPase
MQDRVSVNPHTSDSPFILWVDSTDGLPEPRVDALLAAQFQLLTPSDEPRAGYHIIALSSERGIRKQIKKVQAQATQIKILPHELLCFGEPKYFAETALFLEDWYQGLRDEPIELKDAQDVARDALLSIQAKEISKNQWNIEKEELKRRLRNVSAFDWNQYIRDLEEEIHAAVNSRDARKSESGDTRRSRYNRRYQAVKELWGDRLRLNTLKQRVELDGEPLDLDFVRADLCITLDIDIPKEEAVEIVLTIARKNQYCPIVEYLERVEAAYPNPNIDFDKLAPWLLGTSDRLYSAYLKRHLIGSAARAFNPGCQMDTALILQGDQGIGKSSFFRTLYGSEFFDDTMAEASDKDELMKLHQHWAVEWAEFETQLSRKGYSKLKQFMTTKVDTYRAPYGRTPKAYPRRSILVGSTNELEFLNDPSGDRRYWVIPIGGNLNLSLTEELRDQIWAAAVAAYRAGEQWWLTPEEKQLADEANKPFRTSDTWEEFILAYVQERQFVTIAEVLGQALNIESSKQDKGSQIRAAAILRRLGWDKAKSWVNGTWKRGWINPNRSNDPSPPGLDRKTDRCQKSHEINASSYTDPTDPIIGQHLPESSTLIMEATEAKTEKSSVENGSVGSEESPKACEIEVSPTDPSLQEGAKVLAKHSQTGEFQEGTLDRQVGNGLWDVWFAGEFRPRAVRIEDIKTAAGDSVHKR